MAGAPGTCTAVLWWEGGLWVGSGYASALQLPLLTAGHHAALGVVLQAAAQGTGVWAIGTPDCDALCPWHAVALLLWRMGPFLPVPYALFSCYTIRLGIGVHVYGGFMDVCGRGRGLRPIGRVYGVVARPGGAAVMNI